MKYLILQEEFLLKKKVKVGKDEAKLLKDVINSDYPTFIDKLGKNIKKLYVSYDRDFNKKNGVAIPAYTDQIDKDLEMDWIKENNIERFI